MSLPTTAESIFSGAYAPPCGEAVILRLSAEIDHRVSGADNHCSGAGRLNALCSRRSA